MRVGISIFRPQKLFGIFYKIMMKIKSIPFTDLVESYQHTRNLPIALPWMVIFSIQKWLELKVFLTFTGAQPGRSNSTVLQISKNSLSKLTDTAVLNSWIAIRWSSNTPYFLYLLTAPLRICSKRRTKSWQLQVCRCPLSLSELETLNSMIWTHWMQILIHCTRCLRDAIKLEILCSSYHTETLIATPVCWLRKFCGRFQISWCSTSNLSILFPTLQIQCCGNRRWSSSKWQSRFKATSRVLVLPFKLRKASTSSRKVPSSNKC